MQQKNIYRIALDLMVFLSIIHGWWFVALPLTLVGAWKYPYFFELAIAGLMYDSLFGLVPGDGIFGYIGTISAAILLSGMALLKKILRR